MKNSEGPVRLVPAGVALTGAIIALMAAGGASAQTTVADAPNPTAKVQDIVVTAERREERLQDVPVAISAVTGEQLANAGVETTRDLQTVTSGLSFVQSSFAPQPTIRGIGTRNSNPGDEQVVPIYVDGVYQPFVVGGIFELTDVERVEVLKGPQGTLLGRNATAGAINVITRATSTAPALEVAAGYGSFDERRVSGYASGGNGPVAASLSGQYLEDDGFARDINTGGRTAALRDLSGRAKVVFKPTDRTEITLSASGYQRDDSTSVGFAVGGNTIARPTDPSVRLASSDRKVSLTFLPDLAFKQLAFSGTVVQHLAFADVTSITGYSENSLRYVADIDLSPVPAFVQQSYQYDRGLSEDLFLSSRGSAPLKWTFGAFYFHDLAGFAPRTTNGAIIDTRATTQAYAFYAQGSYPLAAGLNLTAGARYSSDRKCASADNGIGTVSLANTCRRWGSVDPSASLDYRVSAAAMVYVRYSQAFKAGLFNAVSFSPTPVQPERVRSYELGVKTDPLTWLRLNLAGYYTSYDNLQVNTRDPLTTAVILQNAAAARIFGMEADLAIRATQRLQMRVAASWLDAKYLDFVHAQILTPLPGGGNSASTFDASGRPLIRVPRRTASVSADYVIPVPGGTVTLSGNAAYQSAINWTVEGRLRTPGYATVNAQVAWRLDGGRYEIDVWGRNLTDVQVPVSIFTSTLNDTGVYRRPATGGVRLVGKF